MRTIEQIIKFDSGLSIGTSPVTIQRRDGSQYGALVQISQRGVVHVIAKPRDDQMYTGWHRVTGDYFQPSGGVVVWGARDPEWIKKFDNPLAVVVIPSLAA